MGLAAADGTAQLRGEATHVTHHLGPQHLLRCAERPLATPTWRGAAPRLVAVRGERVLVFDPKVSETCATRAIHLHNDTPRVLAPGSGKPCFSHHY